MQGHRPGTPVLMSLLTFYFKKKGGRVYAYVYKFIYTRDH